jgi:uncharacterized protein YcbK (DUF882 family)
MGFFEKHKRKDYACRCGCGRDIVDVELAEVICSIEAHYPDRLNIHGANRCWAHHKIECIKNNQPVTPNSDHLIGKALDFHIEGVAHVEVYKWLDGIYPGKYKIRCYKWGIHISVGSYNRYVEV